MTSTLLCVPTRVALRQELELFVWFLLVCFAWVPLTPFLFVSCTHQGEIRQHTPPRLGIPLGNYVDWGWPRASGWSDPRDGKLLSPEARLYANALTPLPLDGSDIAHMNAFRPFLEKNHLELGKNHPIAGEAIIYKYKYQLVITSHTYTHIYIYIWATTLRRI